MTVPPHYDFELDAFQRDAIAVLDAGESVLVAAPTSSGKTVVAEHAVALTLAAGKRLFYTTPIKALSNQKYRDLVAQHGRARVGLLTGDNAINGDAPIVVMTTEVLRNMIYARSGALEHLAYVVLDEVHYLEDRFRGPVWEEVIIHLPKSVRLVALSATVSNADDLTDWIRTVRGDISAVVEHRRPVELRNLYLVGDRSSPSEHLIPTLIDGRPNREGHRFDIEPGGRKREGVRRVRKPFMTPRRPDVVRLMAQRELLPAIYFVFSRKGCDEAARACVDAGLAFTTSEERQHIREVLEERTAHLADEDLAALDADRWQAALELGIASHHAGLIPTFKEIVEDLFADGTLKVVFATETLALGINMPARTVVIERLTKFTGDHHEMLTPGQYTQLTGRAGRRGLDSLGHAIVLWSPFTPFDQVASLAASRTYVLRSAFVPTYNMVVNLVRRHSRPEATALIEQSFAQFQSERAVAALQERLEKRRSKAHKIGRQLPEDRDQLRRERQAHLEGEGHAEDVADALSRLRPGDVAMLPTGDRGVVLSVAYRKGGRVRVKSVDQDGQVIASSVDDYDVAPSVTGSVELPTPFTPSSRAYQGEVAQLLKKRRRGGRRPTASSPDKLDDDLRLLRRVERAEAEVAELEHRIDERTNSLVHRFEGVVGVLTTRGFLDGWTVTSKGERLARIFNELDLLVSEALNRGFFDGLGADEVAGLVSCLTYEHRSQIPAPAPWFSSAASQSAFEALDALALEINVTESAHQLPLSRRPDASLFGLIHAWSAGLPLADVLDEEFLSGGDFVRNVRLVIDLLEQLRRAGPETVAGTAGEAAERLRRGVVASTDFADDVPEDETVEDEFADETEIDDVAATPAELQ